MKNLALATFWATCILSLCLMAHNSFAQQGPPQPWRMMWQVQKDVTDDELDTMKSHGINLVQSFKFSDWSDADIKTYLDRMQKHGLYVVASITSFPQGEPGHYTLDRAAVTAFINKWKSHPALFAWHTVDEAGNVKRRMPASFQEDYYKLVKSVDPVHPVFVSWNGFSVKQYDCCWTEDAFDILGLQAYFFDAPGKRQRGFIPRFLEHRRKSYPIIITLGANKSGSGAHPPLAFNGLQMQYDFYFRQQHITDNIAYYGWKLGKNIGISQDPDIMRQLKTLRVD